MTEEKKLAAKYLNRIGSEIAGIREHIAGSSEPLPKEELLRMAGEANVRFDIAGIDQLKDQWIELVTAISNLPDEVVFDRERIGVDNIASSMVNRIREKLKEII